MGSIVITGAAKGIGRAIAETLAPDHHVVGVDLDEVALAEAAAALGDRFTPVVGDVGAWSTHAAARDAALAMGGLDGWVNNAGVDWVGGAHAETAEHIDAGLRLLLSSVLYGSSVAVQAMLPQRRGVIVNVSSIQGLRAYPQYLVYGVAKAGIMQVARSVAVDYGRHGIRCNTIAPGTVDTPMMEATLPAGVPRDEAIRLEGVQAPMERVAQPWEIAAVAAFLLSDGASYVNGATIVVDGGAIARSYAFPPLEIPET